MKRLYSMAVLSIVTLLSACGNDQVEKAQLAYHQGKYEEALNAANSCQDKVECQDVLARLYFFEVPHFQEKRDQAKYWFQKAADQGSPYAKWMLNTFHVDQRGEFEPIFDEIRKLADGGDPVAAHLLGISYHKGWGVGASEILAFKYLNLAAEKNYVDAFMSLGEFYDNEDGEYEYMDDPKKSIANMMTWYQKAADAGNRDTQFYLGMRYEYGIADYLKQDAKKAVEYYKQAAANGHTVAQMEVGRIYEYGIGGEAVDLVKAKEWYEKALAKGAEGASLRLLSLESRAALTELAKTSESANSISSSDSAAVQAQKAYISGKYKQAVEIANSCHKEADCQDIIARAYYYGNGVEENEIESLEWAKKAAAAGNVYSQFLVPNILSNQELDCSDCGGSIEELDLKAYDALRKKVAEGDVTAAYFLGQMYDNGLAVQQNDYLAAKYLLQAASKGYVDAQLDIGYFFDMGQWFNEDNVQAMQWYKLAALADNAKAQHNLGVIYDEGEDGVKENNAEALKWYLKSAEAGNGDSQNNLGVMYEHGDGVPLDLAKAREWYEKAAANGNEDAVDNLHLLDHPEEQESEEEASDATEESMSIEELLQNYEKQLQL